jgi:hypothetical protein
MSENQNGNMNPNTPEAAEDLKDVMSRFLDHQKKAIDETGKAIDALFPAGFKEHGNEARREFVKGFKLLVDTAINELEKASREIEKTRQNKPDEPGNEPPASSTGTSKVKVQVD